MSHRSTSYDLQIKPITAKLLYAASAWWGLQQLPTVSASSTNIRSGLCGADVSTLTEMVDSADDAFFNAFYTIRTTFYTHSYPISTQQDTISDIVVTTD